MFLKTMPEEKTFETKEGEGKKREVSERGIEELKEKEKKLHRSDDADEDEDEKDQRKKAIKEKIEREFEEKDEDEEESIEEELEEFEEELVSKAKEDLNEALKKIKKLEPTEKDKAIDALCRDDVFWHLVRTGQIDYGIKS